MIWIYSISNFIIWHTSCVHKWVCICVWMCQSLWTFELALEYVTLNTWVYVSTCVWNVLCSIRDYVLCIYNINTSDYMIKGLSKSYKLNCLFRVTLKIKIRKKKEEKKIIFIPHYCHISYPQDYTMWVLYYISLFLLLVSQGKSISISQAIQVMNKNL